MPLKVIQFNYRVAEVQFVCDDCSSHVGTKIILNEELKDQKNTKIICCQRKNV
jgi:hypothetical protein